MGNLLLFILIGGIFGALPYMMESLPKNEEGERQPGSPFRLKLPMVERGVDGRLYVDFTFLGGAFVGAVISYGESHTGIASRLSKIRRPAKDLRCRHKGGACGKIAS